MEEINIYNEKEKSKLNLNDNSETSSKEKKFFNNETIDSILNDDNEYENINKKLEDYKKNQQKEIECLEKELKKLKDENGKYMDFNNSENINNINNINIDEKIIKQLKEEIIKQIEPKISEEVDKKLPNVGLELIEKKIEENNKKYIKDEIKSLIQENQDKIKLNIPIFEGIKKSENQERKVHIGKQKVNIKIKERPNNLENNNQNIKVIQQEENENNNKLISNKMKYNIYPQKNKDNNINNNLNINIQNNKSKPIIPNINIKNPEQPKDDKIQRKSINENDNDNLFSLFNNIFFKNKQQSSIKADKIDENRREYLLQKFFKYKKEKRENELIDYFDNFLRANVFKIFERKDLSQQILDNIRFNIQIILISFDLNKNTYLRYTYPDNCKNQGIRNRQASIDAVKKFR